MCVPECVHTYKDTGRDETAQAVYFCNKPFCVLSMYSILFVDHTQKFKFNFWLGRSPAHVNGSVIHFKDEKKLIRPQIIKYLTSGTSYCKDPIMVSSKIL